MSPKQHALWYVILGFAFVLNFASLGVGHILPEPPWMWIPFTTYVISLLLVVVLALVAVASYGKEKELRKKEER